MLNRLPDGVAPDANTRLSDSIYAGVRVDLDEKVFITFSVCDRERLESSDLQYATFWLVT